MADYARVCVPLGKAAHLAPPGTLVPLCIPASTRSGPWLETADPALPVCKRCAARAAAREPQTPPPVPAASAQAAGGGQAPGQATPPLATGPVPAAAEDPGEAPQRPGDPAAHGPAGGAGPEDAAIPDALPAGSTSPLAALFDWLGRVFRGQA